MIVISMFGESLLFALDFEKKFGKHQGCKADLPVPQVPLQQVPPQQSFQPQYGPQPTLPQQGEFPQQVPLPAPEDNTVNLFRQMLQAQDEQIRAQQGQISQLTEMVKTLAVASANAANAASSAAPAAASSSEETPAVATSGLGALRVDADGVVKMDVDTGLRSNRAENYIPPFPKLAADKMRTRHEEISTWTAYRELECRTNTENLLAISLLLQEAIESSVPVAQLSLSKGKAARSTKLWYLLKQALTGFQRGTDIAKFVELRQGGAAAGYELWRELDKELSVRSRVEGQALREQALLIAPPKHL
eukprot:s8776_g2.t1